MMRSKTIQLLFPLIVLSVLVFFSGSALGDQEAPIPLPQVEGSKSFDLEISEFNQTGIRQFESGNFEAARGSFSKAQSLALQFRDPGLGMVSFNLGLALHRLKLHEDAVKAFKTARRFARGNDKIINSRLLNLHECGFNPSIQCNEPLPADMHIEGSN